MKIMPTRRIWRTAFRRIRVYLPAVVIVLLLMVAGLPLSTGWMARKAESLLASKTGINVDIARVRVRLATGEVVVQGISLPGATGTEPFRVRSVRLTGSPADMLAGDGSWPETIEIEAPSEIEVVHETSGTFRLSGAAATLERAIGEIRKSPRAPSSTTSSSPGTSGAIPRTPHIVLREVRLSAEPPHASLPHIDIFAQQIDIERRAAPDSPIFLKAYGLAEADSSQPWSLDASYHPASRLAALRADLGAIGAPFAIPGLGGMSARLQGIVLTANGRMPESRDDDIVLSAQIAANRFELLEERMGGEQWIDRGLAILAQAYYSPKDRALSVRDVRIGGEQISIGASGKVALSGKFPGNFEARIGQLPAPALRLLRARLLADSGLTIEPAETSPTLSLTAKGSGEFLVPMGLDGGASIELAGWSVRAEGWPAPLVIKHANAQITPRELRIENIEASFGSLQTRLSLVLPIPTPGNDTTGTLLLTADGDAATILTMTQRFGIVPAEIAALDFPVTASAVAQLNAHSSAVASDGTRDIGAALELRDASLLWGKGSVLVYRASDPIAVDPGELHYENGRLQLNRLTASIGATRLLANATLTGRPIATLGVEQGPLTLDISAEADGMAEDLAALASRIAYIPVAPDLVSGRYHAELTASARSDHPMEPDYRLRLAVSEGKGSIPLKPYPLHVEDATIDMLVTTDTISIRRIKAVVQDGMTNGSTIDAAIEATAQAIDLTADIRSDFKILSIILPYDLIDLYASGVLPAKAKARLAIAGPLDPGPDLLRRWIATLRNRAHEISVEPDAAVRLTYAVDYRQESPVMFFARDFPMRIENIRGNARATEEGIVFEKVLADCGPSKDMLVTGKVVLGRMTKITFDAQMDKLSISRWLDNWETLPEAQRPFAARPRKEEAVPTPRMLVLLEGNVRSKDTEFLGFTAGKTSGKIRYEAWRNHDNIFAMDNVETEAYGGKGKARGTFTFQGPGKPVLMDLDAEMERFDVKSFLTDLKKKPEEMDGVISGAMKFQCGLKAQETYRGEGRYLVEESSLVGGKLFTGIRGILNLGTSTQGKDTKIQGTLQVKNREVLLPDVTISSPALGIAAEGKVTFDAMLDFYVTANVVSRRFKGVPIIGGALGVLDKLGNLLVSFRVEGTIQEPIVRTIPLLFDRVGLMNRAKVSGMPETKK